ncbi:MurT ligase domain-containing protein [Carboxydothermus pertinax]|uniref:Lipid II isoglutaminyl synthase (glutamine-hydrolyzing) subunit MurT n=1 Tax=Carboxydothermus pertinax TaxID=870242 RepID=A0A1L8CRH6_9THEO|nr:MurT ligase domain-containing protein [Carboxydothermus pertinax]GAV21518.1 hypothetical protein cpu_00280 [Carboxydothermus pertinax]
MKIRRLIALILSKGLLKAINIIKQGAGGTALPGKVLLFFDKNFLKEIAPKFKIIMVTGTNGKTTTTRMIGQILKENGINFISNFAGANLLSGIATTFLQGVDIYGCPRYPVALLEVDEATLKKISSFLCPEVLVVTNFFRDQLDRFGEVYQTLNYVKEGVRKFSNPKLVLNADDSLAVSIARDLNLQPVYYGINIKGYENDHQNTDASYCLYCKTKYTYNEQYYGHLGHFKCPKCGYKRPLPDLSCAKIIEMSENHSLVKVEIKDGNKIQAVFCRISLPGFYNIYNGLAALACSTVLNLPLVNSLQALNNISGAFGRMENILLDGKLIKIILVKNHTGFNQALNLLLQEKNKMRLAFLINDLLADGQDVSWLWDVNFEVLQLIVDKIEVFFAAGRRAEDMAVRLKYGGIEEEKIKVVNDYHELIKSGLRGLNDQGSFYVFPTYTALLEFRKVLSKKFSLKEFWK